MNRIYIITGAAGYLGNTIVNKLIEKKSKVRAFILDNDNMNIKSDFLTVYKGNVLNKNSLDELFIDITTEEVIFIHCAAIISISSKYSEPMYDVNVNGVINVLEVCKKNKVKKLVYISSVHAIPELSDNKAMSEINHFDPDKVEGAYAKTKAIAANLVLEEVKNGLNAVIIHPSGLIGPNDYGRGYLTQLIIEYMNRRLTALVKGGYDFVDVRDVADAIINACDKGKSGECYICSNKYYEIRDVMNIVHKISKRKKIKTILPLWFAKLTVPLAETYYKILKKPPLYTSYSLYTLSSNANFSHLKATKELNFKPRPIEETLKDMYVWLKENKRFK